MNTRQVKAAVADAIAAFQRDDGELLTHTAGERSVVFHLARHLVPRVAPLGDYAVDVEFNRLVHGRPDDRPGISKYLMSNPALALDWPAERRGGRDLPIDGPLVIPDVIVHRRHTGDNVLAVEVKIEATPSQARWDLAKLKAYRAQLGYRYAVFIDLRRDGSHEWEWSNARRGVRAPVPVGLLRT